VTSYLRTWHVHHQPVMSPFTTCCSSCPRQRIRSNPGGHEQYMSRTSAPTWLDVLPRSTLAGASRVRTHPPRPASPGVLSHSVQLHCAVYLVCCAAWHAQAAYHTIHATLSSPTSRRSKQTARTSSRMINRHHVYR
jgi:hypothetical protein